MFVLKFVGVDVFLVHLIEMCVVFEWCWLDNDVELVDVGVDLVEVGWLDLWLIEVDVLLDG